MSKIKPPAPRPCGSCPYRRDVPSGVWAESEYDRLPPFDNETGYQPPSVFMCHQQDGRLCAGWCGTHDMAENLGMRIAQADGSVTPEDLDAILDYTTDVPLFESGAAAAEHGMAEVLEPSERAVKTIMKLRHKTSR